SRRGRKLRARRFDSLPEPWELCQRAGEDRGPGGRAGPGDCGDGGRVAHRGSGVGAEGQRGGKNSGKEGARRSFVSGSPIEPGLAPSFYRHGKSTILKKVSERR